MRCIFSVRTHARAHTHDAESACGRLHAACSRCARWAVVSFASKNYQQQQSAVKMLLEKTSEQYVLSVVDEHTHGQVRAPHRLPSSSALARSLELWRLDGGNANAPPCMAPRTAACRPACVVWPSMTSAGLCRSRAEAGCLWLEDDSRRRS
eukprot:2139521-Rhodomonas_salina.3